MKIIEVKDDSYTPNNPDFLEYCEIMKLKPTVRDQIIFMAGMTFQSLKQQTGEKN